VIEKLYLFFFSEREIDQLREHGRRLQSERDFYLRIAQRSETRHSISPDGKI
jgi:hypothetical protein